MTKPPTPAALLQALPSGQPEAKERRRAPTIWRTLQTPEGQRPSLRQQQREARAYAEAWYQALRAWETRSGGLLVDGGGPRRSGSRQMTPVVGNWGSAPYGVHRYTEVRMPLGWLSESAVAAAISRGGGLLERVRQGQGLSSLMHSNGRGWNGPEAREYAAEVLALAAELGDQQAAHQRDLLNVGEIVTVSVDSAQ